MSIVINELNGYLFLGNLYLIDRYIEIGNRAKVKIEDNSYRIGRFLEVVIGMQPSIRPG